MLLLTLFPTSPYLYFSPARRTTNGGVQCQVATGLVLYRSSFSFLIAHWFPSGLVRIKGHECFQGFQSTGSSCMEPQPIYNTGEGHTGNPETPQAYLRSTAPSQVQPNRHEMEHSHGPGNATAGQKVSCN
ncbi:hypothetical protein Nepgr_013747 [Nepenthes gracilis]|uniref:Uncharacterized protein n=1 Tax=Nepenthes gracilis TaxID=150966 RepID=A0AAD3SKA8_NEPGR|nr:hypothetical protein Nepgr_013747 [Nepenthes gracilis]